MTVSETEKIETETGLGRHEAADINHPKHDPFPRSNRKPKKLLVKQKPAAKSASFFWRARVNDVGTWFMVHPTDLNVFFQ